MKIATWNVNGIRARASQFHEWAEGERPDVVCLQELKAELSQVPEVVRRQECHAFWHCCKGYSGVSLQLRKDSLRGYSIQPRKRFWEVRAPSGELVCLTVYKRGAKEVVRRLGST